MEEISVEKASIGDEAFGRNGPRSIRMKAAYEEGISRG
jgi:hypothetical protein